MENYIIAPHKNLLRPALANKGARADIAGSTQREGRTCKTPQARNFRPKNARARHDQPTSRLRRYALAAAFVAGALFPAGVFGPGPASGRHRRQAGGARHRRGRRIRRALRGGRRGRHPLARRRLSRQVHFKDGALVKKDELLFTIDQRPYQAAYDAAKSQIDVWNSLLEFSKAQLERAEELAKTGNIAASIVDDRRREYPLQPGADPGSDGSAQDRQPEPRIHRDQGAVVRPHRSPPGLGRQSGPAGFHLADDDRHARPDRLLFRHR